MASIVLAGGGTAGHIEPALAVARMWHTEHPEDHIIFLGTKSGLETTLVPASGFELALIPKVAISRKPAFSWLNIPKDLIASVRASFSIVNSADLLFGFGGYVSAPAYLAARFAGIPIVVHEANAKPGWANRLGALLTSYLAVANSVDNGKYSEALLTGLPLRSDVSTAFVDSRKDWAGARAKAKARLGFPEGAPLLFIMGGSQGSVAINSVVADSLAALNAKKIAILHSVGRLNTMPIAGDMYRPVAYVQEMALAYLASDVIIARSGAVTCSEFRALGRYALFVPLPVGNGEQFHNARTLVDSGRAEIVSQSDFTADI